MSSSRWQQTCLVLDTRNLIEKLLLPLGTHGCLVFLFRVSTSVRQDYAIQRAPLPSVEAVPAWQASLLPSSLFSVAAMEGQRATIAS